MRRPRNKISDFIRFGILVLCCCLGVGLSAVPQQIMPVSVAQESELRTFPPETTTDRVPPSLEVGQSLYVQTCGACHIAIPPAVFPSQTWNQLIQDTSHYGAVLDPILEPDQTWMRRYLLFASRTKRDGESTPYRFRQSRYFKLLHPQVEMPSIVTTQTCITCHPKASDFNFRHLKQESQSGQSSA